MAQQRHSSEIVLSIDDQQVQQSINRVTQNVQRMQQTVTQGVAGAVSGAVPAGTQTRSTAPALSGAPVPPPSAPVPPPSAPYTMGPRPPIGAGGGAPFGASPVTLPPTPTAGVGAPSFGGVPVGGSPFGAPSVTPPMAPPSTGGGIGGDGDGGGRGSRILSGLARGVPFVGGLISPLISARRRRTGQAQNLEGLLTELQLGGGITQTAQVRGIGALLGYGPEQALGVARSFSQMAQMRGGAQRALTDENLGSLFMAERLGIGAQAIGGFAGGGAFGGGAQGTIAQETQTALQLAGYARQTLDLSGTGTARFLASIAQATQRMATQGMSIDTRSIGAFVQGVDQSAKQRDLKVVRGEGAVRATQVLMGMGGGALSGFKGQFGGLGQGLIQALASQTSSSPIEMIQRMEDLATSPNKLMEGLRGMGLSEELIQLALLGSGASTAQATTLMGTKARRGLRGGTRLVSDAERAMLSARTEEGLPTGMLAISRMQATTDNRILTAVEANKESSVALIRLSETFEQIALDMTKNDSALTSAITGLEATIRELPDTIKSVKETLSDIPGAIKKAVWGG